MSTVYEASDAEGHRVALKLLHPHVADSNNGRERMRREFRMLRKVKGPYVAEVLDVETDDEDAFIVTQLIDGPTLEDDVATGGIYTEDDLTTLAQNLRNAVTSIHGAGVLHRDIKPSNVMMKRGKPVLIDFGIAQLGDDPRITQQGSIAQSPGYTDPQVLRGAEPSESADWWSLAAVLAYAATGYPPFGSDGTIAITNRVLKGETNLPGLSPGLRRAFERALSPDLASRITFDQLVEGTEIAEGDVSDDESSPAVVPGAVMPGQPAGATEVMDGQQTAAEQTGASQPAGATEVVAGGADARPAGATEVLSDRAIPEASDGARTQVFQQPVSQPYQEPYQQVQPQPYQQQPQPYYGQPGSQQYPPEVPAWMRPPERARLIVCLIGVALTLFSTALPVVFLLIFCGLSIVAAVVGVSFESLNRRRLEKGGRFSGEGGWVALRMPWFCFKALFSQLFGFFLGALFGILAIWLLSMVDILDPRLNVGIGAAIAICTSWFMATNRLGREGARRIVKAVAPSGGYRALWVVVWLALVFIAVVVANGSGAPDWYPMSTPFFYDVA